MNNFLLDFLALGAMLSGILVITSKNPVISVLFLISVFLNVAGYLVLLGIGFVGISYIIVYVGAIAILFLFVVMMLNLQLAELSATGSEYTQNLPLGGIVGSLFLFELVSILPFSFKGLSTFNLANVFSEASLGGINWLNMHFISSTDNNNDVHQVFDIPCAVDSNFVNYLQIQSIGQSIYTYGSIWLILTSVILLLAIVGPITLSMNNSADSTNHVSPYPSKKTVVNNRRYYSTKRSTIPGDFNKRQKMIEYLMMAAILPTVTNITEILQLPAGTVTEKIITLCATIFQNGTTHNILHANTNAAIEFTSVSGLHTTRNDDSKVPGCYHIFDPTSPFSGYVGQSTHLGRRVRDHANGCHVGTSNFVKMMKGRGRVTIFILSNKEDITCNTVLFLAILEQYLFFALQPVVNISLIANPGLVVSGVHAISKAIKALWRPLYLYKVSLEEKTYTLIHIVPNTDNLSTLANTSKSWANKNY